MPEKKETEKKGKEMPEKRPVDMTTEELLDYALAPELAEKLREVARGERPDERESEVSEDVEC